MSLKPMMSDRELSVLSYHVAKMSPGSAIVEYGSGGSTHFFASRLTVGDLQLYSVEHDPEWYMRVAEELEFHSAHHRIHRMFVKLGLDIRRWRFSEPEEEMPAGAGAYIWAPSVHDKTFRWDNVGLVFVDGLARGSILAVLRTVLNPGTLVLLHDYAGREFWYDWAIVLYDSIVRHDTLLEMRVPG